MINRQLCRTVRKPNEWNKYEKPISNLIYAILMQAISDANGYIDGAKKYHDGEEAVMFLDNDSSFKCRYAGGVKFPFNDFETKVVMGFEEAITALIKDGYTLECIEK